MNLEYAPLLQVQRDLYRLPRGFDRFQEYLRTMIDADTGDLKLPLVAMNPMGKDHLLPFLETLIEIGADAAAARATADAHQALKDEKGSYKVCLVVSDDFMGGWTNRYTSDFGHRVVEKAYHKRGWITGVLWTSQAYGIQQVREEILLCIFRAAYIQRDGYARTLGEVLNQEAYAMRMAGSSGPALEPDDLAYTREVLKSHLHDTDQPTIIAALYGDDAARQLGYPPLGLSAYAGLALACEVALTDN